MTGHSAALSTATRAAARSASSGLSMVIPGSTAATNQKLTADTANSTAK